MKYKVLITAPYFQPVVGQYREIFDKNGIEIFIPPVNERMSEKELLGLVRDIDGIICGDDQITERVLDQASRLKVIVKWGTGTDSINKEAAAKRGVLVKNTPNAFTASVADTVFGFILCFARATIELDEKIRRGIWEKKLNCAMHECTLGVIGVGNVGRAVIKRARAFGMKVLANDVRRIPFNFMVPLEQLLQESDFVSLNCDLNPTSFHLMNPHTLSLMKPTAYLINTSRGSVVDELAMIEALVNKKIAGAGLDVFENEPLPDDSPLKRISNVILSPHNANSSITAWEKVNENSVNNLIGELCKPDEEK